MISYFPAGGTLHLSDMWSIRHDFRQHRLLKACKHERNTPERSSMLQCRENVWFTRSCRKEAESAVSGMAAVSSYFTSVTDTFITAHFGTSATGSHMLRNWRADPFTEQDKRSLQTVEFNELWTVLAGFSKLTRTQLDPPERRLTHSNWPNID